MLVQIFGEVFFAFFWESILAAFRVRGKANRVLACFGYLMLGAILGAFAGVAFPHRFSKRAEISLLGVLLNAAIGGTLAYAYGRARTRAGKPTTNLATFWGGAWFACGIAATRLLFILCFRNG